MVLEGRNSKRPRREGPARWRSSLRGLGQPKAVGIRDRSRPILRRSSKPRIRTPATMTPSPVGTKTWSIATCPSRRFDPARLQVAHYFEGGRLLALGP